MREKPDEETAKRFLNAGNYYWNSGVFIFKASSHLKELRNDRPAIYAGYEEAVDGVDHDMDFVRVSEYAFWGAMSPSTMR